MSLYGGNEYTARPLFMEKHIEQQLPPLGHDVAGCVKVHHKSLERMQTAARQSNVRALVGNERAIDPPDAPADESLVKTTTTAHSTVRAADKVV